MYVVGVYMDGCVVVAVVVWFKKVDVPTLHMQQLTVSDGCRIVQVRANL